MNNWFGLGIGDSVYRKGYRQKFWTRCRKYPCYGHHYEYWSDKWVDEDKLTPHGEY